MKPLERLLAFFLGLPLAACGHTPSSKDVSAARLSQPEATALRVMSSPQHLGLSRLFPVPSGLPGSSADLSPRAVSYHPGRSDECSYPLLPHRCQASPLSGGLATFQCITGPNRVRLRCGLRVRPCKASPEGLLPLALAGLLVERVIYKVNSFQFTRSARLVLAHPE